MKAIHLVGYGNPTEVLKEVDIAEPGAPGKGEVLVEVDFAPVNLSDLMLAMGIYFLRPDLPSVIGGEGAGRVVGVGPDVKRVRVGDMVTIPFGTFSWARRILAPADAVFVVPEGIDVQQASMLNINPTTAVLLLSEFSKLKPGDWVAFNAANSQVGRSLLAVAKSRGIKTVCIVRRPELVDALKADGADFVGVDSANLPAEVMAATNGASISLGLDAVGGPATDTLAKILGVDSQIIVYALMSGQPVSVNQGDLVGKKMAVRGFWMYYSEFLPRISQSTSEAAALVASGALSLPVTAVYRPAEIKSAVEHLQRGGKVVLDFRD